MDRNKHITLVDLNNFAYYPTLAIGFMARYIRDAGYNLDVISPLSKGVKSVSREKRETTFDYFKKRLIFSQYRFVRSLIELALSISFIRERYLNKSKLFRSVASSIKHDTNLVLISTYTENYSICKKLAKYLNQNNIPVIVGGPGFNNIDYVDQFTNLKGVTYVVGSEIEKNLEGMLQDFFAGKEIEEYPGVYKRNQKEKQPTSYVFKELEDLPVPDYSDFPWDKYPMKVIPYMTGRGCSWGKCNFCTDVHFVNGRTYRSQSLTKVLGDLKSLGTQVGSDTFNFIDLKLNSNLKVWRGIIDSLPDIIENPKWFCAVHVDNRVDNGLDLDTLKAAKKSGLTRITFGLETASQRLLDDMKKGTTVERLDEFVNSARIVGVSLRATMFIGYPDETVEDLRSTLSFLQKNEKCFDRIRVSRFQIFEMAPVFDQLSDHQRKNLFANQLNHLNQNREYKNVKVEILKLVTKINSRKLQKEAIAYDGIM